eukprot:5276492-Pyramimonas_sp.AAC.1
MVRKDGGQRFKADRCAYTPARTARTAQSHSTTPLQSGVVRGWWGGMLPRGGSPVGCFLVGCFLR